MNMKQPVRKQIRTTTSDLFEYVRARSFYKEDEASCNAYDSGWDEFVVDCWDNFTRASKFALRRIVVH